MTYILHLIGVAMGGIAALGFLTADPHLLGLGAIGLTLAAFTYATKEN